MHKFVRGDRRRSAWMEKIKEFQTIGEYKILSLFGKGSFAKVFFCQKRSEEPMAMKVIRREKTPTASF